MSQFIQQDLDTAQIQLRLGISLFFSKMPKGRLHKLCMEPSSLERLGVNRQHHVTIFPPCEEALSLCIVFQY